MSAASQKGQTSETAVDTFARAHDDGLSGRRYQNLIPLSTPKPGQQFGFQVDLDACTGCKSCVTACHHMNGLDQEEGETWRTVGLLQGGSAIEPVQQTITTACHHCVEPACMKGCPVNAYEKDPVTGIVRHLDDQCIGCQYCTLTCPYEVPQFNKRLGIVRKCDMCTDRLAAGEAPACVQGCPNEAITIRIVDTTELVQETEAGTFLPGAPSPDITIPTTRYVSKRPMPRNMLPANFYRVRRGSNHDPLTVMLVLTQWSVGMFFADAALGVLRPPALTAELHAYRAVLAACVGLLALLASTMHLGRPLYAFRALIGLRTSWLSREILMFGLFAKSALGYAAVMLIPPVPGRQPHHSIIHLLAGIVLLSGMGGVICSVLLYAVTQKQYWSLARTGVRFVSTVLLAAFSCALAMTLAENLEPATPIAPLAIDLGWGLATVAAVKFAWELGVLIHLRSKTLGELKRSAVLLTGGLRTWWLVRFMLGGFGGVAAPLMVVTMEHSGSTGLWPASLATLGALTLLSGELVERGLFFRAVSGPAMPGGVAP